MKRLLSNSTKNHNPQGSIKYLFGLHGLTQPSDFQQITNQTLINVKKLVNKLEQESIKLSSSNNNSCPNTDPHKLLYLLDCISNELCKVIDVAEIVRNIHYNNDFKQAAEESFTTLSNTVHDLNTNNTIYYMITILLNKHISILNEEEIMFLTDMKHEYENEGIHLPDTHKQTLINLQNNIVSIETEFMNNTINDNTIFPIYNIPKHNITYVREWLQKFVPQNDPNFGFRASTSYDSTNSSNSNGNSVLCTSNKRISLILLKSLQNEDNRRDLYYNIYLQPYNNIHKLGQLIQYRQKLAYTVNKLSYTHKFLEKQAIKTPLNVVNVLEHLSDLTRPKAESELYQLQKLKSTLTSSNCNTSTNNNSILYPWDVSYYTAVYASINKEFIKEVSVTYNNNTTNSSSNSISSEKQQLNTLSSYFSLYHTIKGILFIIYELFNIQFILQPLDNNEKWTETENKKKSGFFNLRPSTLFTTNTSSSSGSNNTYSSSSNKNSSNSSSSKEDDLIYDSIRNGVFKYNVYDLSVSKDALIGTVYIDTYQRKGKFPGMY